MAEPSPWGRFQGPDGPPQPPQPPQPPDPRNLLEWLRRMHPEAGHTPGPDPDALRRLLRQLEQDEDASPEDYAKALEELLGGRPQVRVKKLQRPGVEIIEEEIEVEEAPMIDGVEKCRMTRRSPIEHVVPCTCVLDSRCSRHESSSVFAVTGEVASRTYSSAPTLLPR